MALALSLFQSVYLSIYLYVCYFDSIIARILRGVRTYITIPPIRVLFLFTKKQCHSVLYLSEFTRHSKLLKYKSDHRMAWTWTINLRKTFWFDFLFRRYKVNTFKFTLLLDSILETKKKPINECLYDKHQTIFQAITSNIDWDFQHHFRFFFS